VVINLPDGQKDKLCLYGNDTFEEAAAAFSQKHGKIVFLINNK